MASRLAGTIFSGTGNDALVAVDAYKVSTGETRNSLFGTLKGVLGSSVEGLYANKSSIRELTSLILQSKTGTIDRSEMLERSLGAMGSSLPSLLGQLGGTLKNSMSDALGTFLGDDASESFKVIYNNAELLIGSAAITDAQDMSEFLVELTGNADLLKVVNVQAESAIFGAILKELVSFGIPELLDDVVEQIQSEEVRNNALAYLSSTAVKGSDLAIINKVIDTIGLTAFLEQNPDAIRQILSNFFFGSEDTVETWPAKRIELFNLLSRINAHWREYLRNGNYIPNLEPFIAASNDAKSLLMLAEPERTLTLTAKGFQPKNVREVMKELYPNALIS